MNNSDIFRFINSGDVRNYLKDKDYQFSSAEAAWLVSQCLTLTLRERHEAWQDIVNTMPDSELKSVHFDSGNRYFLHDVLTKGIAYEQRRLSDFCSDNDKAVYTFDIMVGCHKWYNGDAPFFSGYSACLEAAQKETAEINSDADPEDRATSVIITKRIIDCSGAETLTLDASRNLEPLSLEVNSDSDYSAKYATPDSDMADLTLVFQSLWFSFPTPFKKGDIVRKVSGYPDETAPEGPLVIESTASQERHKPGCHDYDISDMRIDGYCLDDRGMLYWDYFFTYMDYEYFPEEKLTGRNRILKALSSFLRGEIAVDLFANACISIFLAELSDAENFPGGYTREGLSLAGLNHPEQKASPGKKADT